MQEIKYRKMVLRMSAGTGMDAAEFYLVEDKWTEDELANEAWNAAVEHAQMYGLEPDTYRDFYEEDDEINEDAFTSDIEGYFEEYDPDVHDGLRFGNDDSWQYL